MQVVSLDPTAEAERQSILKEVERLKQANICPTCHNMQTNTVYPSAEDRIFYEDEFVVCMLEQYPRNPGHAIVLMKQHYEDISELPVNLSSAIFTTIQKSIHALKAVLPAEKVYLCTMCDGKRNHLHIQLIPRLEGDAIQGSRLFVKPRGLLTDYHQTVAELRVLFDD